MEQKLHTYLDTVTGEMSMHSVLGIGVDMVYLPRVTRMITNNLQRPQRLKKITSKFMSLGESNTFHSMLTNNSLQLSTRYMAGIWASKEAVYKALSSFVPCELLPPAQIVYSKLIHKTNSMENGMPIIDTPREFSLLYPEYSKFYNNYMKDNKLFLSLSHDGDYLIAYTAIGRKAA